MSTPRQAPEGTVRTELDSAARWCRSEAALWRHTLGGVVVLPAEAPAPLALAGPAAGIWDLLGDPMTVAELLDIVATTYEVAPDAIADEVRQAVGALVDAGALCRS